MFALAHIFTNNFFSPVMLKLRWRSERDEASSHCGNGKHKLMTVCQQQLLQMFPWHRRGCLWGWPTSHVGLRVPAGKVLPYCYWVPLKWVFTTSFCDWSMLKNSHYQKLSHWSFCLVLFSILTWCWISSISQAEVRSWRPKMTQLSVCEGASTADGFSHLISFTGAAERSWFISYHHAYVSHGASAEHWVSCLPTKDSMA